MYLLLNAGLNPRQKDSYGQVCMRVGGISTFFVSFLLQTPLHSASIKGDIQCAEMLMEHVMSQLNDIHSFTKPQVS